MSQEENKVLRNKIEELEDELEDMKSEAKKRKIFLTANQHTALSTTKSAVAKETETQDSNELQPVYSQPLESQSLLGKCKQHIFINTGSHKLVKL